MNTPIFHQTISMTLKSLNSLDLDFRRKGLESLELREAIEAVTNMGGYGFSRALRSFT